MACNRFFMLGMVLLLFGIHFRVVDSLVLNQKTTQFVEQRVAAKSKIIDADTMPVSLDPVEDWWYANAPLKPNQQLMTVTPPKWLGWSLVSVGAVLILTCPCFRA